MYYNKINNLNLPNKKHHMVRGNKILKISLIKILDFKVKPRKLLRKSQSRAGGSTIYLRRVIMKVNLDLIIFCITFTVPTSPHVMIPFSSHLGVKELSQSKKVLVPCNRIHTIVPILII